ncbi:MAG: PD-(D/E)XK nuclease family protein, partial [Thermoanaerobaculia bacterium]
IVPSHGVAESVAAAMMKHAPGGVAGLRLRLPEALALEILNAGGEYPRVASRAEQMLAMSVATERRRDETMQGRGMAAALLRSYRDVRDSGITLETLRRGARKLSGSTLRARLETAFDVWSVYETLIAASSAVDPADVLEMAATAIRNGASVAPQILFGFYDATGIQLAFFNTLMEAGRLREIDVPVELHAGGVPPELSFVRRFLDEIVPTAAPSSISESGDGSIEWSATAYRTPLDEMSGTALSIRRLIDSGVPPESIGVVWRASDPVRDETFAAVLSRFGLRPQDPPVTPLGATRIGRTLRLLLRIARTEFPREEVVEIAAAGVARSILRRRVDVGKMDEATRKAGIAGGGSDRIEPVRRRVEREHPGRAEGVRDYLDLVRALEHLLRFPTPMPASDWAALIERFADSIPLESDADLLVAERIDGICETLRRARKHGGLDASAIEILFDQCEPLRSSGGDRIAIRSGDLMSIRGATFEHLFFAGMEETAFPQRRAEDPLLPDQLRRRLGVREIGDGRDEEQLLLELALSSVTTAVHFSWPKGDGMGRSCRPSPLLEDYALRREPAQRETLLHDLESWVSSRWPRDEGTSVLDLLRTELLRGSITERRARQLRLAAESGSRSHYDGYLGGGDGVVDGDGDGNEIGRMIVARLETISPTRLEPFGECPQKFLISSILGVSELDDPELEVQIERRRKGILDHGILERFYQTLEERDYQEAPSAGGLHPDLEERLRAIVEEEFSEYDREHPPWNPTMRKIEREETVRWLSEFVASDLRELQETGFRPIHFEYRFGQTRHDDRPPDGPPVPLSIGGVEMVLRGIIDRIDERPDDHSIRVIDYKSGKAARQRNLDDKINQGKGLQLPLYAIAAAANFGRTDSQVAGIIRPLRGDFGEESKFSFDLAGKRSRVLELLGFFVDSMRRGAFPAFPSDETCHYCPVSSFCRTRHDEMERAALSRIESVEELLVAEEVS